MADASSPGAIVMTAGQRLLVRRSFEALRDLARPASLLFYGRLFELDPAARLLFHNDLEVQGRKLMETLGAVAESLEHFDSTRARLVELGRQHAGYGVRIDQYETVTAALMWTLGHVLGQDFDAPTREAWKLALAAVGAAMKEGHLPP
jgi:hemoglobin-like flavoprotein